MNASLMAPGASVTASSPLARSMGALRATRLGPGDVYGQPAVGYELIFPDDSRFSGIARVLDFVSQRERLPT